MRKLLNAPHIIYFEKLMQTFKGREKERKKIDLYAYI